MQTDECTIFRLFCKVCRIYDLRIDDGTWTDIEYLSLTIEDLDNWAEWSLTSMKTETLDDEMQRLRLI